MTPLDKLRDKLALEYSKANRHLSTFEHFHDGFDAALSALTDASGEFKPPPKIYHETDNLDDVYEAGAAHQFEQDRAGIGLAETRLREGKLLSDADNKRIHELEARLAVSEERCTQLAIAVAKAQDLLAASEALVLKREAECRAVEAEVKRLTYSHERLSFLEQRVKELEEIIAAIKDGEGY